MIGHARTVGAHMRKRLGALAGHPLVGEVAGVGLLCGIELVQDKQSHANFPAEAGVGARMDAHGQRHGLILRVVGDRIIFAPPLIIDTAEVDDAVERFARALDDTWAEVRAL